jgi:hypothetical protein
VKLVLKGFKARLVRRVSKEFRGYRVRPALPALKAHKVFKVRLG